MEIVAFFTSPFFILRVLQPIAVWILFKYQSIFSLLLTLWLFITTMSTDLKTIYRATLFAAAPSALGLFYTLYLANTGNADLENLPSWCGFIKKDTYALEYVLTFIYAFLIALLIRVASNNLKASSKRKARRPRRNATVKKMSISENLGFWKILFAFIVSYSFFIALGVLFWIGLSQVNIFHLGLTLFFVVFLVNPKIASKYWIGLLLYICFAIFLRYRHHVV